MPAGEDRPGRHHEKTAAFSGETLLCAGAAGGIGRAALTAFSSRGGSTIGLDRIPVSSAGVTVKVDGLDEAAVFDIVPRHGPIHYALYAIGAVDPGPLESVSLEAWRSSLDTNLTSAFIFAKAVHNALAKTRGCLVFIASSNGLNGGSAASGPAYAAAKAGIINLTRYLAKEWAPQSIRVNSVAPGPVDTPMLDRFSQQEKASLAKTMLTGALTHPDEVAKAVLHIFEQPSMTGAIVNLTGGLVLD